MSDLLLDNSDRKPEPSPDSFTAIGPQRGPSSVARVEAQSRAIKRELDAMPPPDSFTERTRRRLECGEAHVLCNDCGARLWSTEGHQDIDRSCPYMRHGKCDPK